MADDSDPRGDGMAGDTGRDLVVVALPGVQSFIAEARTTGDVAAASGIYQELAKCVVDALNDGPRAEVILPGETSTADGVPNRIVALVTANEGAAAARAASDAVHQDWRALVHKTFGDRGPETPGFPRLQWVCVPPGSGGYREQWERAQRLLAARRNVRDFRPQAWQGRVLCSLTPRWPAEPEAPSRAPKHEKDTKLSAVGWVKRLWREERFPSTPSVASVRYRIEAAERVDSDDDVRQAVHELERLAEHARPEQPVPGVDPGLHRWLALSAGPWVYPERWQPRALAREAGSTDPGRYRERAGAGERAARRLREAMREVVPLPGYLAVLVQDLDGMGRFLGERAGGPDEHKRISRDLLTLAAKQREALRDPELSGVPVYAGGDDLLAFVPAATALTAARRCHDLVGSHDLPAASTAVLFFHYHASIQQAMREARDLLDEAKKAVPGKHALAVGYLRRSGVRAESIQPWDAPGGGNSAELFTIFARGSRLSPRLVADLERDSGELVSLMDDEPLYRAELARLVRRHTEGGVAGRGTIDALDWLSRQSRSAGKVGVFLRQEAR
jgi:hypothetical protein